MTDLPLSKSGFSPRRQPPRGGDRTASERALTRFSTVMVALILREFQARFGEGRLAILWTFVETAAQILIIVTAFGLVLERVVPDANITVFLTIGLGLFNLYRNCFRGGTASVTSNRSLFNFRHIHPLTVILARMVVEITISVVSVSALFFIYIWIGIEVTMAHPLEFLTVVTLMLMMYVGIALTNAVLNETMPEIGRLIGFINRPLLFVSCVLYPLSLIPEDYRIFLLWNPLVFGIEMAREAAFTYYDSPLPSPWLILPLFTLAHMTMGLLLLRRYEDIIIRS